MADARLGGKRTPVRDPVEHFWSKVDCSGGPDACWPWMASKQSGGYGQFNNAVVGRWTAHTYAYVLEYGPIPEGHHVDHECHNDADCEGGRTCPHRACCNPRHLVAKAPRENADAANRPRQRARFKTHCPQKHEYTQENTGWIFRRGHWERYCRQCNRDRARRRKQAAGSG